MRFLPAVPERARPLLVFLATFALIASVQWYLVWDDARLIDGALWVPAIEEAMEGRFPDPEDPIYGYPGTTFLFPAMALHHLFGIGAAVEYRLVMTFLPALAGALAAMLAFVLRPRTFWWAFVAWLYAFQSQFSIATPPSGLFVAFLPLLLLVVLYAAERKPPTLGFAAAGALGGVMLATRLESAIPVLGVATFYLSTKRLSALYIVPLIALGLFMALNPSLWIEGPIAHLGNVLAKVLYLSGPSEYWSADPLTAMLAAGKLGLVALALAALLLATRSVRSLPRGYLAFCTGMTLAALAGLSLVEYHPTWLYAPFLVAFQMFLPLLALDAYDALPPDGMLRRIGSDGALLRILALVYLGLTALAFWTEVALVY